jgi:hypothetical protein
MGVQRLTSVDRIASGGVNASGNTTAQEATGLRKIQRERRWIWFWVLTYIPMVLIVRRAIHSNVADSPIILIWAMAFVASVARVIFSRCPRCGGLFFSPHGTPTLWNFFATKCMQCGVPLKAERVIYPSLE